MSFSRRTLLKASAATAVFGGVSAPYVARAPGRRVLLQIRQQSSGLPSARTLRAKEMAAAIKAETKGRFDLQMFPNNQLGSDTDMLSQIRSGGIEFFTLSGLILATLVPAASINGIGFAFPDYDTVWKAMDGDLGAYVRGEINKAGLEVMDKIWDNGFRQTTSSTKPINGPDDFKGFKIRVPVSPLWTSMFKAFDASPASINFSEVYSALQTKIVEGQENPLAIISTAKLYEVQKYCSLTNHMWDGFWFLANRRAWQAVPERCAGDRRQAHQRRRRQGARRRRQAQCRPAAGAGGQGPGVQPARPWRRSATSCAPPASMPSGRANMASRPGRCSKRPSASCRNASGGRHGSRRNHRSRGVGEVADSPLAAAPCSASLEHVLGIAGRNPGGAAGRRRDRDPVCRRGGALRAACAADLVGRTRLDPVPVAGDAGRGGGVPPLRAHAHDGAGGERRPAAAGLSRRGRDLRGAGVPAADRASRPTNTPTRRASSPRRRCRFPTPGAPRRCRSASA